MIPERSATNLLLLCAGLLIWSSAFVTLYAALSVGCAFGWEDRSLGPVSLQRGVLIGLWIAHLAALGLLLLLTWRRSRGNGEGLAGFLARTALWAAIVSVAVTIVNYAPILGLSTCL